MVGCKGIKFIKKNLTFVWHDNGGPTKSYYPKLSQFCADCIYIMLCLMSFEKKLDLVGVALCQILPCN